MQEHELRRSGDEPCATLTTPSTDRAPRPRVASEMALALSDDCPEFALSGTDDKTHDLASFADREVLVVAVSCNHCPYVVAYEERMIALAREYGAKNVGWIAVNANDATRYPDDGMQPMKTRARDRNFPSSTRRSATATAS